MSSTTSVLGAIGAMQTLVENFPMSLLALFKGKQYTCVFDFMIDLLQACGVDMNKITEYLIENIYGINADLGNGIANIEELILNGEGDEETQNEFLSALEGSIKTILIALLNSIFGCSAVPIIPTKYMDCPTGKTNSPLWINGVYPNDLIIPISYIDPMGILEVSPTSVEGGLYYNVGAKDVYYRKVKGNNILSSSKILSNNNKIYLDLNSNNEIIFKSNNPILENINITVGYIPANIPNMQIWDCDIKIGTTESDKPFKLHPINGAMIKWITINGSETGINSINGKINFSKTLSQTVIDYWENNNSYSLTNNIKWGDVKNTEIIMGVSENEGESYVYEEVAFNGEYNKECMSATRMDFKPSNVTEKSPEFIVIYDSPNPNNLYKTMDMNAFIWFCIKKGNNAPQVEKNHMMWNTRLWAKKRGIELNDEIWNKWFSSKGGMGSEFDTKDNYLEPILQITPKVENGLYSMSVSFPAQRYYGTIVNSSLFKFNVDYLGNIQILKPKQMLAGLVRYLLGGTLSTLSSIEFNYTQNLIKSKLSSAIKQIIEADDMEVEDCYTSFSNEEFDSMMEDMLISRYNSTYYGGETTTVKTHNIEDYIRQINSINQNTKQEGNITAIKKIITEVTATPATEAYAEYGFEMSYDGNIMKKLIWAITMPLIESIFTPQVMLLMMINYRLLGILNLDNVMGSDMKLILNVLLNKMLGLIKQIIKFIKDKIIELLLLFFFEIILPLIVKYMYLIYSEQMEDWLNILRAALKCLPVFIFKLPNVIGAIDEVNYADITTTQNTPESTATC